MHEYSARVIVAVAAGLFISAAVGCHKSDSPKAEAKPPKTAERPAFTFLYPADWMLNDHGEFKSPDRMISVETSPGVMFTAQQLLPDDIPADELAAFVKKQQLDHPDSTKTEFEKWGRFSGVGAELRWKTSDISITILRVFIFKAGKRTLMVSEVVPSYEEAHFRAGFKLVQDSFQLKE